MTVRVRGPQTAELTAGRLSRRSREGSARRSKHGQSLVLLALCMLIVVVLAMMTLGIGQRVREKIELQTLTDAAAYSDATLVARAYNEVALSNRGIVGDMVAMAATYSLVDYASTWEMDLNLAKSALGSAQQPYQTIVDDCATNGIPMTNARCACAAAALADPDWAAAQNAIDNELARVAALPLDALDTNAAGQANDYRDHAIAMHEHASMFINEELSFKTSPYQVAKTYARNAKALPNELKAPVANDSISLREVHHAMVDQLDGPEHRRFVDVGRGTRYQFVLKRTDGAPFDARFKRILGSSNITLTVTVDGTADWVAGDSLLKATDTMQVNAAYSGAGAACGASGGGAGGSSSLTTIPAGHIWPGYNDPDPARHELKACDTAPMCTPPPPQLYDWGSLGWDTNPPEPCTLPICQRTEDLGSLPRMATAAGMAQAMVENLPCDPCPGVWPAYLGIKNACENDKGDLFCQPKQYAILQRDYGARSTPDPWNLAFRFNFTGTGAALDLNRQTLADGTDITRQTAVAGGLAYYHYQGGARWAESPNLLNPFWRSTLAPMDIDATGNPRAIPTAGNDIPNFFMQAVNRAAPTSRSAAVLNREVFLELERNGFQGVQ